jgi:uncharacterized protein (TIRG00374 family)
MKKNVILSLLFGIIISAAALYFAVRNVPFSELLAYLSSINYWWILPSAVTGILSFALRTYRWQIILKSAKSLSFWPAFHPLMIGFMLNCILPGRVGEVARPVILHKKENVPFSVGLATVAVERVFDLILLITLLACVLMFVPIDPNLNMTFGDYHLNRGTLMAISSGIVKMSLVLIAGIILVSIQKTRQLICQLILKFPTFLFFLSPTAINTLQQKLAMPAVRQIDNFASGFALIKQPKSIGLCLLISTAIWVLSALSYYIMAQGCPGINLSFLEIFAMMIIICFFIALPSAPGFWGLWEAGGIFALAIFGVTQEIAAGYTLANHAIQLFPVIIAGLASAMITSVNIWQVSYGEAEPQRQPVPHKSDI